MKIRMIKIIAVISIMLFVMRWYLSYEISLTGRNYLIQDNAEDWNGKGFFDDENNKNDATINNKLFTENDVKKYLSNMSLSEKIAQMFIVLPESLFDDINSVTAAGERTENAFNCFPVGGFIYMENNLLSYEQTEKMLRNVQQYSLDRVDLPLFLCVDEEGGAVTRIAQNPNFNVPIFEDMSIVGERGNENEAYDIGSTIGGYLNDLGFNVDFAPVADILTNDENTVVKKRAFSSDPKIVSRMARGFSDGLSNKNVLYVYKHFPGHGNTVEDSHEGFAFTNKSFEEIEECELIPFKNGIENNAPMIMVGHISVPNITNNNEPASLSFDIVTDLLRKRMNYDGLIITDALNMGAIAQQYNSSEAVLKAVQAGVDILLMPLDFNSAYNELLDAVDNGTISEKRINESVERIIKAKLKIKKNLEK